MTTSKNTAVLLLLAALGLSACTKSELPKKEIPPSAPRERTVSISAKPNFRLESAYDHYTIEIDRPGGKKFIFWPADAPKPDTLDKNCFYRFDLLEKEEWLRDSSYWSPEIVKVHDGQKLLFDASICSRHHIQMDRKLVGILYGLISNTPEWKTLRESAPNDGTVLGGCSVDMQRLKTRTWVCPTCKSLHDEAMARMSRANQ